jgi:hypothetical protein
LSGVEDKRPRSGKHQMFRALFSVPADDWKAFGDQVGDTNRAGILRAFVAWFLRKPGAKLPERPPRAD